MIARITADGQIHLRVEDTESEEGVSTEPGEAVEEHAAEDQSHNPILPEMSEFVYAAGAFLLLLALMYKFAFPAVQKAMDSRTQNIRDNLDEAERTKADAQRILEEYQLQLADAKNESARIIDEARQTAEQMRRDLMVRAEAEVNELRERSRDRDRRRPAAGHRRPPVAGVRAGHRCGRDRGPEEPRPRHQPRPRRALHRAGRDERLMAAADRNDAYATALFEVARAEGSLERVEAELYQVARAIEGNEALRSKLTDQALPVELRQGIVEDLLGDRTQPVTKALVSFVVGSGRARDLPKIIDLLVQRTAEERQEVVADIRSAIPLDDDQQARLADALSRRTGQKVSVKVNVDPSILGGIVATIGDTVIDGSIRRRLDQLKESL